MSPDKTVTNRLIHESSPYLQQHAHNPVDWYPWGPEALERARKEQKPIFLSIGYSACHWCHVMEHESFTDDETAAVMNQYFVNIKVDREERQDLDHIYMSAVQVMTQHGGWPMSVFLTPALEPFYGGTYFPPQDRHGMPSFKKVLLGVANAWNTRREEVLKSAKQLSTALEQMGRGETAGARGPVEPAVIRQATEAIAAEFDSAHGGFGSAPKFFHTMHLKLMLRHWASTGDALALAIVTKTLDAMANGGIYDHLGGGFHRYSTDAQWLVPHFEKMLYDNALLAEVYLEAYQATRKIEYATCARETLDYVLREMTDSEGGFYSTQDADSEGVEGKFYVWSREEIFAELDPDRAELFCRVFGVSEKGNWEETNILNLDRPLDRWAEEIGEDREWLEDTLAAAKRKLFSARQKRVAPFRDEKVLVSWNGLMIDTMAKAHQVLGDERFLTAARNAARFLLEHLVMFDKQAPGSPPLYHVYKDGKSRVAAYLDDYATLANALVSLYESDFDLAWLRSARALADVMIDQFWDRSQKTFFFTARQHEKLLLRPKEWQDGATPSGTSMAVTAIVRLGRLSAKKSYAEIAREALEGSSQVMSKVPLAVTQLLLAYEIDSETTRELALAWGESADDNETALRAVREALVLDKVVALRRDASDESEIPLLKQRPARDGKATLYVCQGTTCLAPLVGAEAIAGFFADEKARKAR
jgi:uncharacterized protein YyaL (SSP411 family)